MCLSSAIVQPQKRTCQPRILPRSGSYLLFKQRRLRCASSEPSSSSSSSSCEDSRTTGARRLYLGGEGEAEKDVYLFLASSVKRGTTTCGTASFGLFIATRDDAPEPESTSRREDSTRFRLAVALYSWHTPHNLVNERILGRETMKGPPTSCIRRRHASAATSARFASSLLSCSFLIDVCTFERSSGVRRFEGGGVFKPVSLDWRCDDQTRSINSQLMR